MAAVAVASAGSALPLPSYQIAMLGLTDADHTGSSGNRVSVTEFLNESGYAAGVSSRFVGAGLSTWVYDGASGTSTRVGLFDAAHTRSDGHQFSRPTQLSDSTYAAGYSFRFGGSAALGESSWVYDAAAGTTTRVGYFDSGHTRSDGYQFSFASDVAESGATAGYSERFDGADARGYSAWLYDGTAGTTTQLGLIGADHTRSDGYRGSFTSIVTNAGLVAGSSERFAGADHRGQDAWLYDRTAATTTLVGLVDAAHTRSDGFRTSFVDTLMESGDAAGTSLLGGDGSLGQSAWVYDGAATTRVGYFDADHTGSDGYQHSQIFELTETGYAAGHSTRYALGAEGQSAWLYDVAGATTTRLGLVDAVHTDPFGLQSSTVQDVTDAGNAIGTSLRFDGFGFTGQSAWVYERSSSSFTRAGLTDAEHTGLGGEQSAFAMAVTESGYAIGDSQRFGPSGSLGSSAWLYDGSDGSTTRLGLTDAVHTRSDGTRFSGAFLVTESGYVAGSAGRFSGSDPAGNTAWIYDAATESQYSIVLSEHSSGFASSQVSILTEEGLALGSYQLFDENGFQGEHAFAWTAEEGAVDLGALVEGGLDPAVWEYLQDARLANQIRQLVGQGRTPGGGSMAYLLTPLPEAGSFALLGLAAAGLVARRSRTRS